MEQVKRESCQVGKRPSLFAPLFFPFQFGLAWIKLVHSPPSLCPKTGRSSEPASVDPVLESRASGRRIPFPSPILSFRRLLVCRPVLGALYTSFRCKMCSAESDLDPALGLLLLMFVRFWSEVHCRGSPAMECLFHAKIMVLLFLVSALAGIHVVRVLASPC